MGRNLKNLKNLKGKKFGMLTVIKDSGKRNGHDNVLWECLCDCGNTCLKRGGYIRSTKNANCGCLFQKRNNLVGRVFGRLTVIFSENENNTRYTCLCECGNSIDNIMYASLVRGERSSCGCIRRERKIEANEKYIYRNYLKRAKRQRIDFSLTYSDLIKLIFQPCYYCGSKAQDSDTIDKRLNGNHYNGIDRIDSSQGYTVENCVPCCGFCNRAKFTYTVDKFQAWIKRLVQYTSP